MGPLKRKALEAAGWRFGDAADFLGMSDEERQLLDARVKMALAVRQLRLAKKMSQKQLALRIKTTQPRIAKIEQAAADVSMDQILRAYTAAGGRIIVKQSPRNAATPGKRGHSKTGIKPTPSEVEIELIAEDL